MYLRVAHKDENRTGISAQREIICNYRQKHTALPEYFEEIIDEGYSGFDGNAPGLKRIIQLIKQNKVAILIVSDLSRLTRDCNKARMYMEELFPNHNVHFIAVECGDKIPEIHLNDLVSQREITS